ncbi:MAG: ATPase inhibitor subunit zeta [Magnetospirillum sp.]
MNTGSKTIANPRAFDHERAFQARADGVRQLGLWAADKIGLRGGHAQAYALALVSLDVGEADDDTIMKPLLVDLQAYRVNRDELTGRLIGFVEQAAAH